MIVRPNKLKKQTRLFSLQTYLSKTTSKCTVFSGADLANSSNLKTVWSLAHKFVSLMKKSLTSEESTAWKYQMSAELICNHERIKRRARTGSDSIIQCLSSAKNNVDTINVFVMSDFSFTKHSSLYHKHSFFP